MRDSKGDKIVTIDEAIVNPLENLGRDLYLNPENDITINSNNNFSTVRYYNNLIQAIIARLKTQIGELSEHPNYGSRLNELIGTVPDDLTLSTAKMYVFESLVQEPRIDEILEITPYFREGSSKTTIDINLVVKPIKQLEPLNLVYSLFV